MKKKTTTRLIFGIALAAIALGSALYAYRSTTKPKWIAETTWIYVRHGDTPGDVIRQLNDAGADTHSIGFQIARRYFKFDKAIENGASGAYRIGEEASAMQVVRKIARRQQDPIKLTFIGTRTMQELAGRIAQCIEADSTAILQAMFAPEFLSESGCNAANISSIFLPDTYQVYWNIAPESLMQRMLAEYRKFWNDERLRMADKLHLTPQQICAICSIAEEETTDRQERAVVARLYWNRLQKKMPLQADPTVKYALGDFMLRRILNIHLKADSPYNTYRNAGLPPGPIRVVEKATIDAFLHSAPHKYIYMCAKEDFSGLHNFATNLVEHQRNAKKYHQALKAHGL